MPEQLRLGDVDRTGGKLNPSQWETAGCLKATLRRKCPADAGDVVRERPPGLGGTAGSNPPCTKRRSRTRFSPPRRSQLNGISPNLRATHPRMLPEFRRAAETACRCSGAR